MTSTNNEQPIVIVQDECAALMSQHGSIAGMPASGKAGFARASELMDEIHRAARSHDVQLWQYTPEKVQSGLRPWHRPPRADEDRNDGA